VVRLTFGLETAIKDGQRCYNSGVLVDRKLLQAGTWRVDYSDCQAWCAEHDGMGLDLVCVQTPIADDAAMPMWNNRGQGRISPVSIARNAALSGWYCGWFEGIGNPVHRCPSQNCRTWGMKAPEAVWRAAWGWTGRISADARDAAQIAVHGASEWGQQEAARSTVRVIAQAIDTAPADVKSTIKSRVARTIARGSVEDGIIKKELRA